MDNNKQSQKTHVQKFVVKDKNKGPINKKDLFLPSLKSNLKNDPAFYNNDDFIANTKSFYNDLNNLLDENTKILESICNSSGNIKNKQK